MKHNHVIVFLDMVIFQNGKFICFYVDLIQVHDVALHEIRIPKNRVIQIIIISRAQLRLEIFSKIIDLIFYRGRVIFKVKFCSFIKTSKQTDVFPMNFRIILRIKHLLLYYYNYNYILLTNIFYISLFEIIDELYMCPS